MRITFVPEEGIGRAAPVTVKASLVLVEHDNGTVVAVAAPYGVEDGVAFSHAEDPDFNDTLVKLGVDRMTVCDRLVLPPAPPGARLISRPTR